MKGNTRKVARSIVVVAALAVTTSAHAMLPVWDIPNFVVNIINKKTLLSIDHQLRSESQGTVNYYTKNTYEVTKMYNEWNYVIDNDYTWIIGNGDEDIGVPKAVTDKLKAIMNGQSTDTFTAHYKTAGEYKEAQPEVYSTDTLFEGSRARKAANDALVESVARSQDQLGEDTKALELVAGKIKGAQGTGRQMQVANALAGSQVSHLIKLRSMMLASEASRAAEAQVAADKDARAIAVSEHLNKGLSTAVAGSMAPLSSY